MNIYINKKAIYGLILRVYLPIFIVLLIYAPIAVDSTINAINSGIVYDRIAIIGMSLCVLLFLALLVIPLLFQNYIILNSGCIIIRNVFFKFLDRKYRYIEACHIGFIGGGYPDYIHLKINNKWTMKWRISLVDRKDYSSLIAELKNKGVIVNKKNII